MSTRLWVGAGVLAVTAFTGKQWLWTVVSTNATERREREHEEASLALQKAHENARKYVLPPLTAEEKQRLREIQARLNDDLENQEYVRKPKDSQPQLIQVNDEGDNEV